VHFPGTVSCQTTRTDNQEYIENEIDIFRDPGWYKVDYVYKNFGIEHQGIILLNTSSNVTIVDENDCIGKYSLFYTTGTGLMKIIFILILLGCCGCCFHKYRTRRRGYIHTG